MTATFQMSRDLGWDYFEKLAKQKIMQVQSATDPPKKLALGERAVMADGNEYVMLQLKEAGQPVEIVYPTEGTPLIVGPNAIFKNAPNPNAARLLQSYMFTPECQQLCIDSAGCARCIAQAKEKPGRKPLSRNQADEGRRGRGREAGRGDQEALQQDVRGLSHGPTRMPGDASDGATSMKRQISRRDVLKGSAAVAAGTFALVGQGAGRRRRRPTRDHAGADQGGARRKARSSTTPRSTCRSPSRSPRVRGEIPGHRACGSSAPAPSACSSASARNMRSSIHAVDVVQFVRRRAFHRLEARRHPGAVSCRRTSPSIIRPEHKRPGRPVRELPRLALLSSATTPTW